VYEVTVWAKGENLKVEEATKAQKGRRFMAVLFF
jgi:hypothetical protein